MHRSFLKRFPLFIWLCLPSLRCLISALTQAGGGDLLLRFPSSIQSCCGEGGSLQADVAVCGEPSPCSGQASCSFGGLSPGAERLFPPRRAARVARGLRAFSPGAACLFPPRRAARAARGSAPSPPPPTSSGDGAALLWSFSVPLFCEPPAVCSGRLIFPSLSHSLKKAPSDCSQGLLAGPYPKQCPPLLSVSPPLAGGGCGHLGYFSARSCF